MEATQEFTPTSDDSAQQAQKLFDDLMVCQPLLKRDEMTELDRELSGSRQLVVARRLGLALAIHGGDWFKNLTEDKSAAVVVAGQLEGIESYLAMMRELIAIIEAGVMRVRIALSAYSDIDSLMEKAGIYSIFKFEGLSPH